MPRPESAVEQLQSEETRLRASVEQIGARIASATEQRRLMRAQLNEDEQARAARATLVSAYRREAFARAAEQALTAAADEVIANSIGPLEDALRQRWKLLMGGAGVLRLQQGQTRLEHARGSLQLAQLSGAEQAIATLLTRMLILVGSTQARFLWLDEPLEHLDPKNRRAVASTLVRTVERGEIEQVVITTYEEKLARRLASRSNVAEVVYVRASERT
jgi:DNA repair exonuclease SbcCD ATPase subunit